MHDHGRHRLGVEIDLAFPTNGPAPVGRSIASLGMASAAQGSMGTRTALMHTMVGSFRSVDAAHAAVSRLDEAQIPPRHVSLIAGDPELAAAVGGHSDAIWASLGGIVLGFLIGTTFLSMGGPGVRLDPAGIAIGALLVASVFGVIGFVFGRRIVVPAAGAPDYRHTVEQGGAIVAVTCSGGECARALAVLNHAGADEINDEDHARV